MTKRAEYQAHEVAVLWCGFAHSRRQAREGELASAFIGGLFSSRHKARWAAFRYRSTGIGLFRRTRLRFWVGGATVGLTHWSEGFVEV